MILTQFWLLNLPPFASQIVIFPRFLSRLIFLPCSRSDKPERVLHVPLPHIHPFVCICICNWRARVKGIDKNNNLPCVVMFGHDRVVQMKWARTVAVKSGLLFCYRRCGILKRMCFEALKCRSHFEGRVWDRWGKVFIAMVFLEVELV